MGLLKKDWRCPRMPNDDITTEDIIRLRNIKIFPICVECRSEEKRILRHAYQIM